MTSAGSQPVAHIRAFVQTRGTARATDYAFVGGAPPEPWWRAYRDVTAFDHPTVLVTSDGGHWSAYLSGVPSSRLDAVGTVVRYTLVLDGPCGTADAACVLAAIGAWLDDVAAGHGDRPGGRFAAALDARFPADDVERWLAGDAVEPDSPRAISDERHPRPIADSGHSSRRNGTLSEKRISATVRRRALAALAGLPAPSTSPDEPGEWIGALGAPGPRAAFVTRVAALVDGAFGRALLLNLIGGPTDAVVLADPTSPVAVLVESTDPDLVRPVPLRPVVEAKKALAAAPTRRTGTAAVAGVAVLPVVAVIGMLALTALVVTLLVWLL